MFRRKKLTPIPPAKLMSAEEFDEFLRQQDILKQMENIKKIEAKIEKAEKADAIHKQRELATKILTNYGYTLRDYNDSIRVLRSMVEQYNGKYGYTFSGRGIQVRAKIE